MLASLSRGGCRSVPRSTHSVPLVAALLVAVAFPPSVGAQQQGARAGAQPATPPTIEAKTEGMTKLDGFFPLYHDVGAGELWMEIPRLDTEVLYIIGLASGLGSNDIGLDRGILQGSRIVEFERAGNKVLMIQPNYDFRASTDNAAEVKAVTDAFARSVLWGFTVGAATGDRVLVEVTDFLLRDATNIAQRLRPGSYRLDASRSAIYPPMILNFPSNTEMEAELTFVSQPGAGGGGGGFGGGGAFEGVGSVAATGEAASLRLHHSFVELPGPGYETRKFDPRSGFGSVSWQDYSTPLGESMTKRFTRRHRLEKRDPTAAVSDPVEPIVYYLDPGTPEPIRSALLEGARWWNQAFEAAGYRNAFQVEILPDDVSPHDIRYNVINWVHRSTRGWSTGASVTDPRTGEIIKGVVTLGSLRVRQDYMIAEGLLAPYATGDETPPELAAWALARIRQLAAHEVGHTLGIGHNYYDSRAGRISVMDYPHPLVTLASDGTIDHSEVYEHGIGEWDSLAITWGYQDFPAGANEDAGLDAIIAEMYERDLVYLTNQDIDAHPRADQWSNGADAAAELNRMMDVRRVALTRFGERAIRRGMPLATLEEVLVPLYLHHRYQVEATASVLGGADYGYAFRGDGRVPFRRVPVAQQRAALGALTATLAPSALALPRPLLDLIPPRPPGFGGSRELFPRYTGDLFDAITPAIVAAEHTVSAVLAGSRAARLVEQHALDPSLPGLDDVIDALYAASFDARVASPYEEEIRRAVERVVVDNLMQLAGGADMPQVRAIATYRLQQRQTQLAAANGEADTSQAAHIALIARDIEKFLDRPMQPYTLPNAPNAPPGAPIGDPGMDWLGGFSRIGGAADSWLRRVEPYCSWGEVR
jgi:Met-zincin/Domain of unknown function (DUF5117)